MICGYSGTNSSEGTSGWPTYKSFRDEASALQDGAIKRALPQERPLAAAVDSNWLPPGRLRPAAVRRVSQPGEMK
jgi:hypothetical protein